MPDLIVGSLLSSLRTKLRVLIVLIVVVVLGVLALKFSKASSPSVTTIAGHGITKNQALTDGQAIKFKDYGQVFNEAWWNSALNQKIHADVTESIELPDGRIAWIFGDTTSVNGQSTVIGSYPHSAIAIQTKGTQNFSVQPGNYGLGWQQVPNWPDGTYFWMTAPLVEGNYLYVLGSRIQGVAPFTTVGNYIAKFDVNTLSYLGISPAPSTAAGTLWGYAAPTTDGWWVTGTHSVDCANSTNCRVGDMAFVPKGGITNPNSWQLHQDVLPATTNIGTKIALIQTGSMWQIFTKLGDAYGSNKILQLTAGSPTANWSTKSQTQIATPAGTISYAVAIHPEQASPQGKVLISYNVNGVQAEYFARFLYMDL